MSQHPYWHHTTLGRVKAILQFGLLSQNEARKLNVPGYRKKFRSSWNQDFISLISDKSPRKATAPGVAILVDPDIETVTAKGKFHRTDTNRPVPHEVLVKYRISPDKFVGIVIGEVGYSFRLEKSVKPRPTNPQKVLDIVHDSNLDLPVYFKGKCLLQKEAKEFFQTAQTSDIVWIGETHGIAENYKLYQYLIPKLLSLGYQQVALEYPPDLSQNWPDGRFSKQSRDFLNWLTHQKIDYVCFDKRTSPDQQESERQLAQSLIASLSGKKTIVITGGFHSQKRSQKDKTGQAVIPLSALVETEIKAKILRVGVKYSGGSFYNFGIKKLSSMYINYDPLGLEFGEFSPNTNSASDEHWWLHAGPVSAITLLQPKST